MKKFQLSLVLMISFLFLFTVGCQVESTLSGPEQVSVANENHLDKKSHADKNPFSVTKKITVKKGGKLSLKLTLDGEFLGQKTKKKVKFSAEIKFEPGLVLKDQTFTMTLDPKTGMISFSPQMDFMTTPPLTISVKGVNLQKMDIAEEDIKFAYADAAGDMYFMENDKVWFKNNSFGIKKVELPHFNKFGFPEILKFDDPSWSRYGFTK